MQIWKTNEWMNEQNLPEMFCAALPSAGGGLLLHPEAASQGKIKQKEQRLPTLTSEPSNGTGLSYIILLTK